MNPIKLARDRALESRQRLRAQLGATHDRLLPSRLTSDARNAVEQRIRDTGQSVRDHIANHPVQTSLFVSALLAWIFRKPLLRVAPPAARAAYDWLAGYATANINVPDDAYETDSAGESYDDDERDVHHTASDDEAPI
jgi:hypothetical protein